MRFRWNSDILILFVLVAVLSGCSGNKLPDWMSSEEVDPIISPTESSRLSSNPEPSFTEIKVDSSDVRPLTVEDLVQKASEAKSKPGDKKVGEPGSARSSSWDGWENNLNLAPLETPVEPGKKGKGGDTTKKSTVTAKKPPVQVPEKPKPEHKTPSKSDILEKLITSESDGGPVSYKDIQDKLFPKAKMLVSEKPESRPASRPAKPVKKPVATAKGDPLPKEVGPVPVEGRSRRERKLLLNKDVVISGGAVQVNQQYITADGILDGLHEKMLAISRDIPRDQFEKKALEIISNGIHHEIQQRMVSVEAERAFPEHVEEQIDAEVDKVLRRKIAEAGGSEEALRNNYLREGITLESVMSIVKVRMMVQGFLQQKLYPRIVINRRTLWNYYRKHKADFSAEKKVGMQIIAAPFADFPPLKEFYASSTNRGKQPSTVERSAARKAADKHIRNALKALENGGDFTAVAKAHSMGPMKDEGGVWDVMSAGNKMEKNVEDAVFKMKEGERSGIIEEETGFFIVKARKVQGGKVAGFVEAQDEIEKKLRQEQYNKLRNEYFTKIYDRATIIIGNDFLRRVVDRSVERYW